MLEERDAGGSVVSKFFRFGEKTNGNALFYETSGGCNNVVSLTDNFGTEVTTLSYGPFGEKSIVKGTVIPVFGYASYYSHERSGLNLTRYRAYSALLGIWLSRDPAGNVGGANLHGYANNNPVCFVDPSGLAADSCCKYTKEKVAELTMRLEAHFERAVEMVANGTSRFSNAYIGAWENTILGNRIDRTFKDLVDLDSSLSSIDIHIHSNYGAGPDILTKCPDIYWEATSVGQKQAHIDKFNSSGYFGGLYKRKGRTPDIFTYVRVIKVGGVVVWVSPD